MHTAGLAAKRILDISYHYNEKYSTKRIVKDL